MSFWLVCKIENIVSWFLCRKKLIIFFCLAMKASKLWIIKYSSYKIFKDDDHKN